VAKSNKRKSLIVRDYSSESRPAKDKRQPSSTNQNEDKNLEVELAHLQAVNQRLYQFTVDNILKQLK